MKDIPLSESLVSMCGLYCGACRAYLREKCKGCKENAKATWCKVRDCCLEKGYSHCAECTEHSDPAACSKFNNIFSKLMGVFLNSDRRAGILMIHQRGKRQFAEEMVFLKRPALKKRG
jgi:hypothetical protein